MDVKTQVFKRKTGRGKDKWCVRLTYFDDALDKVKSVEHRFDLKRAAEDKGREVAKALAKTGGQIVKGRNMTFEQLTVICKSEFYKPAVIIDGLKVPNSGIRSYPTVRGQIDMLNEYFGKLPIGKITRLSLTNYKIWRLERGSRRRSVEKPDQRVPITMTTVDRELAAMCKMMRYALGEGWIVRDIFFNAKVIGSSSSQPARTRILTHAEEQRLLEFCEGSHTIAYKRKLRGKVAMVNATISLDNPHLKAMIILAVDTAMRKTEILKLRWDDIDFDKNFINVLATHTKTEKPRIVPLSARAKAQLLDLREFGDGDRPFPFVDFKRSWATVKEFAGIGDLHFHDLRRTAITRWQAQGTPMAFAGKFAGHTELETTNKHYTATDVQLLREMVERQDSYNSRNTVEVGNGMVN